MHIRDPQAIQHEDALVKAFILPNKQERCLYLLADPKRRKKFTTQLGHFRWFNPAYTTPVLWKVDPSLSLEGRYRQGIGNILALLRSKGAGPTCWVISNSSNKDAKESNLETALESRSDCILSCIPGQLAYFEGEDEALILQRDQPLPRIVDSRTERP